MSAARHRVISSLVQGIGCLSLVVWCCAIGVGQEPETMASSAVEASAEQIARWVKELDDDRFVIRRNATDRLILAGAGAVQPVAKAVEGANLEVSTRGIYVLRELALSVDIAASEAALEALQQLAASPTRTAARLAQSAILAMGDVRQQRAIKQLEQLGATITVLDRSVGFQLMQSLVVVIGPSWQGTVQDLQRLKWLRDVQEISFEGERVTDAWLEPIVHLTNLNRIVFRHAGITDDALRQVAQLKSLLAVDLMYTPVTDRGLEHLKELKSVRMIRCYGTQVTREAAERFQAEVASVQVDHKVGAFLGVVCQQPPWPCEVIQVKEKSAALLGGVQVHDIIVRYDGKPVANFDELRKFIGQNKVGDSVAVEVARGGQTVGGVLLRLPGQELGFEGESTAYGCKVKKVKDDGAAAKAGLRVGDVIVALDDERIADYDQFRKLYEKNAERKEAEIQVLRDVQIVRAKVTFGEWNE